VTPATSDDGDSLTGPGEWPEADATDRLLLALTSLYVQRPVHTAEEQQQYAELALRLIDRAGPETCAAVAARLRRHPDAPAELIGRLGDAPCDSEDGVPPPPPAGDRAGCTASPDGSFPASLYRHAADAPSPEGDRDLADREPAPCENAGPAAPPIPLTPEIGEAFFATASEERRRMLSLLAPRGDAEPSPESSRRFHVRIDTATWRRGTDAFARDFARLIDAPRGLCERILNDPSGEPMVVAARAAGMPAALLQRILLLSPAVNHSVQNVHELTDLYHGLDGRIARGLLAVWRSQADGQAPQRLPAIVENSPPMDLRARFRALNVRIQKQATEPQSAQSGSGKDSTK
jgi:hypothetical protein